MIERSAVGREPPAGRLLTRAALYNYTTAFAPKPQHGSTMLRPLAPRTRAAAVTSRLPAFDANFAVTTFLSSTESPFASQKLPRHSNPADMSTRPARLFPGLHPGRA